MLRTIFRIGRRKHILGLIGSPECAVDALNPLAWTCPGLHLFAPEEIVDSRERVRRVISALGGPCRDTCIQESIGESKKQSDIPIQAMVIALRNELGKKRPGACWLLNRRAV